MRTILRLELRQLLRERTVRYGVALLFVASCLALLHGTAVIEKQRTALGSSPNLQREQHQAVLGAVGDANAGDQLYYLFFHTAHEPSIWAPLAIGLRDVQAYNLKIRLLALHGQLYDADVGNPLLAAFGHLDFSFVVGLLAPLLMIALCYSLWSGARELGLWDLVRAQTTPPFRVLLVQAVLRTAIVVLPLIAGIAVAILLFRAPLDSQVVAVLALVSLYLITWMGIGLVVAACGRSSDFNLIVLLGIWIVVGLVGPALVNVAVASRYPLGEALELTVRQRQAYHAAWDQPLPETMQNFYRRYPEWAGASVPRDVYSNAWYYAMQQRGDDAAESAASAYFEMLERRRRATRAGYAALPSAWLQQSFNAIAQTDLGSYLNYLRSVAAYHERLKRFFFPAIFDNRPVRQVRWSSVPTHRHQPVGPSGTSWNVAILAIHAGATVVIGSFMLRWRVRRANR